MGHFEMKGVELQYNANSLEQANKNFARSCHKCSTQGKPILCTHCAIEYVHNIVVECFSNKTA